MRRQARAESGFSVTRISLSLCLCLVGSSLAFTAMRARPSVNTPSGARIYVTTTAQKIGGIGTGGCSLQEAIYSSVLHQTLDGGAHGIAMVGTDPDDYIATECVMGTGHGDAIVLPTGATFNVDLDIPADRQQ